MNIFTRVLKRPVDRKERHLPQPKDIWKPFDPDTAQIRLLHVQPSAHVLDPLICSLDIVSLDDKPYYEALSYAWGNSSYKRPITLHNRPWSVTTSLDAALRHLRPGKKGNPLLLWVDALCIDQSNLTERAQQVQKMKRIYSEAVRVRVWLGEASEDSSFALSFLEQIGTGHSLCDFDSGPKRLLINNKESEVRRIKAVVELLERPWWTRLWTLQELVLARTVILHCGYSSVGIDKLLRNDALKNDAGYDFGETGLSNGTVRRYWQCLNIIYGLNYLCRVYRKGVELSFLNILARGQFYHSSDPRDAIYGLIGLADSKTAETIVPDYTLSTPATFASAALSITDVLKSLDILSFTEYFPPKARIVPTWVPQWRKCSAGRANRVRLQQITRAMQSDLFNACKSQPLVYEVTRTNVLKVSGILLGSIVKIDREIIHEDKYAGVAVFARSIRSVADFFGRRGDFAAPPALTSLALAAEVKATNASRHPYPLWRIFVADMTTDLTTFQVRRCRDNDCGNFCDYVKASTGLPETQLAEQYHRDVRNACEFRRPFRMAQDGLVGFGPAEMRPGDVVHIFKGGRVPYILRPLPGAANGETFELVGDCFIGGVMDGEAVGDAVWQDVYLA